MAEIGSAASEAHDAISGVVDAAVETANAIADRAIENAEQRVAAAEQSAEQIALAAERSAIGQMVNGLREEFSTWQSQIMNRLSSLETDLARARQEIADTRQQAPQVLAVLPGTQSSSTQTQSQDQSETLMAEVVDPSSVSVVALPVAAAPQKPKGRRLI